MYKLFFNLLSFIVWVTTLHAQPIKNYNFTFKTYSTVQGLPDNNIIKTIHDKNGFLWIATHNGIARFDGSQIKTYTHNPYDTTSLRSIWVSDLLIDDNGMLWASTEFGLCFYNAINDKFVYVNNKNEMHLMYKMPLCKGNNNSIWIACEDGLKQVNTITKLISNSALKLIADPQFIIQVNNQQLLIGTRGKGLYLYSTTVNTYTLIENKSLPTDVHYMDAYTEADTTWIATSEGILCLQKNENSILYNYGEKIAESKINQLMCVTKFKKAFGSNKLICGTYNKRLVLFNTLTKVFEYEWLPLASNPNGYVPSIINDIYTSENIMWIGTERGLYSINLNNQQQQSYNIPALVAQNKTAIVKKIIVTNNDKQNLAWLIPWQPYFGICLYNLSKQVVVKAWHTIETNKIYQYTDLIQSKYNTNQIIAARDSAIDIFTAQKGCIKTIKIKGKIYCVHEDIKGNIWAGLDDGIININRYNKKIQTFIPNYDATTIEKNAYGGKFPVMGIKEGENNLIWLVCGKYGLFSFNTATHQYLPHRQPYNGAYSTRNRCSDLQIILNDSIWISNMAGISCYIPSQNKFLNYDIADGLKSSYVYSLATDKNNNIWGRGNADIFCFDINTKKVIASKPNLPDDISAFQQKIFINKNQLYVGHEGGYTILNTNDIANTVYDAPIAFINKCTVNNDFIYFKNDSNSRYPTVFSHNQNQINFELQVIEFNYPETIQTNYMLEGLDNNWTTASQNRMISYNHLAPGNYKLAMYASNTKNNTKSKITYWHFIIQPAWWQHWWFWPCIAILFTVVVYLLAKQKINKIKQKEIQKTIVNKAMAELETKMLRSQMNPHFIFNSLNSIQKYIWENKEEDAAEYLASFAKLIRAILENSLKETITLHEEIKVVKLYTELEHRRSNANFNYTINLADDIDPKQILISPLLMQPFIENAIWHGLNKKKTTGNLSISIAKKENQLICVIDDDGVGRQKKEPDKKIEKKSLGIAITQQRINKIIETTKQYAAITIVDKVHDTHAMGTTVTLTLPLIIYNNKT